MKGDNWKSLLSRLKYFPNYTRTPSWFHELLTLLFTPRNPTKKRICICMIPMHWGLIPTSNIQGNHLQKPEAQRVETILKTCWKSLWFSNSDANKAEAVLLHVAIPCAKHSNKDILVHGCTQALLGINSMACAIYREWQIQELLWLFQFLALSLFKFRILFLSLYKAQCKSQRFLMAPVDLLLCFNWTRSSSDGKNLRQIIVRFSG